MTHGFDVVDWYPYYYVGLENDIDWQISCFHQNVHFLAIWKHQNRTKYPSFNQDVQSIKSTNGGGGVKLERINVCHAHVHASCSILHFTVVTIM